jgi:hypothetical protein
VFDGSWSPASELEPAQEWRFGREVKLRSGGRRRRAVTVGSSRGQQINDVFDSFVGAMVRGLEATVGSVLRIGVDGESGCWQGDHIAAYGRTETITRPEHPLG